MLVHAKVYRDGNLIIEGDEDFDGATEQEVINTATEHIQNMAFGEVEVLVEVLGSES